MKSSLKVSIVTPAFNSVDTIEDCIRSVAGQTYPNIQHIIIDGRSTDGTLDIIEKYSNLIAQVISEPDNGIYDALNKGIEMANGDVIGILHSDDLYADNSVIETVVNYLLQNEVDSFYGDLVYVGRNDVNKIVRYWKAGEFEKKKFEYGWMPPHPTFFVRRKIYEQYGFYDLRMGTAADYELMLRFLYKHEISTSYIPKVLVKMRAGGKSNVSLKNRLIANLKDIESWKVNGLNPPLFLRFFKPLRKLPQFFQRP